MNTITTLAHLSGHVHLHREEVFPMIWIAILIYSLAVYLQKAPRK
jgi:hypothetical protein